MFFSAAQPIRKELAAWPLCARDAAGGSGLLPAPARGSKAGTLGKPPGAAFTSRLGAAGPNGVSPATSGSR